ncbi:MAG TPA: hypothetical protein PK325_04480 [Cyclobacteriaceae bacterium]|nr:hypothetical protein [Cyclobacteriaceae bacterium]HMV11134.1 hypothetical protein [Cyclobacteriaceae bacterium]HMV90886.1 hypothetical protein [Cyclobacteriaceae bacterium]HMX01755.1 hypothetical protein [Cyclobacteriaceae bacterium]HMX51502.1 hypothetical protein [Cyclobacteriaceae bacterium]
MPFYTSVISDWSPSTVYQLDSGIYLLPNGSVELSEFPLMISVHDVVNFYTEATTLDEHIIMVKKIVALYSFIFSDNRLIRMFDKEEFNKHIEVKSISSVPVDTNCRRGNVDFSNIGNYIYIGNTVQDTISFKDLYMKLDDKHLDYFVLYFNSRSEQAITIRTNRNYKIFDNSYNVIVGCVTLLEILIGHAETCTGHNCCSACGKSMPHRKMSENQWLSLYLEKIIDDRKLAMEYQAVIKLARQVRHVTVHAGKLPTAETILDDIPYDEYPFERAEKLYQTNKVALSAVVVAVGDVTRALILNKLYGLNHFFPIPIIKVTRLNG